MSGNSTSTPFQGYSRTTANFPLRIPWRVKAAAIVVVLTWTCGCIGVGLGIGLLVS